MDHQQLRSSDESAVTSEATSSYVAGTRLERRDRDDDDDNHRFSFGPPQLIAGQDAVMTSVLSEVIRDIRRRFFRPKREFTLLLLLSSDSVLCLLL